MYKLKPTTYSKLEYVQENLAKVDNAVIVKDEELDKLWEDMDEFDFDNMD